MGLDVGGLGAEQRLGPVDGRLLDEARLSEELGVGRTPLREALKRLESEHLVVTYPRRGTFATTVDIVVLPEMSRVRKVL